jgi:hypothetical protein
MRERSHGFGLNYISLQSSMRIICGVGSTVFKFPIRLWLRHFSSRKKKDLEMKC